MTVPADYSDLTIVIPAFNEEAGIVATLRSLTSEAGTAEIIVIDDCSNDATAKAARSFAAVKVLRHEFNCGQGRPSRPGCETQRASTLRGSTRTTSTG